MIMRTNMENRKVEIRAIVLDILFGKEPTQYGASQFGHLAHGVAEVMARRDTAVPGRMSMGMYPELSSGDKMILQEVFWDLFLDRVITIGLNADNPAYPWFRLHSSAEQNLKKN